MKKNLKREEYYDCEIVYKDRINKALAEMLDEKHLVKMAEFFKVFGDETRLKILNMLDNNSLCVCSISAGLGMTKSAISHQLRKLREMNLVKAEKIGKEVWYSLADEHIKKVFEISAEHIMEDNDD
ncbi:MAG: winged helix-turn-helix transcriptional regulator [Clostridia bacterium]|nr:winged helix-turn-helix transcriptional regulator [Clostridia bacterium]